MTSESFEKIKKVTEQLVRKRAEHNEMEIFSLEEISLHQQDIEKIEHLDRWCKDLKILYLQSNLISRIENVGRLKKLEYLNLALNNIERIENLEGCEFLNKLDLTVNFVGELTSVDSLIENIHLKELYLTGNPCTDFEGYRDYVVATLPQLKMLDGVEITKSERIKALQNYKLIYNRIIEKQTDYLNIRAKQKEEFEQEKAKNEHLDVDEETFWKDKTEYTPECRLETHKQKERLKQKQDEEANSNKKFHMQDLKPKERKYFSEDGRPYSFNDPKVDYEYNEDNDEYIYLSVFVFKHMDSSLINVDIQTNYVRVTLKGKSLQLALSEEIKPDSSSAQRSQTTGQLVIKMPKVNKVIRPAKKEDTPPSVKQRAEEEEQQQKAALLKKKINYLEVDDSTKSNKIDLANIVSDNEKNSKAKQSKYLNNKNQVRENSPDFVDNLDVPPLN